MTDRIKSFAPSGLHQAYEVGVDGILFSDNRNSVNHDELEGRDEGRRGQGPERGAAPDGAGSRRFQRLGAAATRLGACTGRPANHKPGQTSVRGNPNTP